MTEPEEIAWCNGQWGSPHELTVPLSDRGLNLADGLFETLLVRGGRALLLGEHLERMARGCALLGLGAAPDPDAITDLVNQACSRSGLGAGAGQGALRLSLSRGSGGRGLAAPDPQQPRLWLQLTRHQPLFTPVAVVVSRQVRRNPASLTSRCKTFAYTDSVLARREARAAGADDAVLLGSRGELSCASAATLLIRRRGLWLTPSLDSGCLPGTLRARALALGLAREEQLDQEALQDGGVLINSLGCRAIGALEGTVPAQILSQDQTRALFNELVQC